MEEHLQALEDVLKILEANKLYIKLNKCVFCATEIPCLGDFVGKNRVRIDPDKVKTIKNWPTTQTQDELHSFLGLTSYVQKFCHHYSDLASPLFNLLKKKKNKKNAKILLNGDNLKRFKELKQRLQQTPVLHLADFNEKMHLRTDASQFAIGGVLFQIINGIERPIALTSRKMKPAELNYPTQQQELLVIVHSLATFRVYCLDNTPIVETGHRTLETTFTQKTANRRLARWYDILAEYQPEFLYLPGKENVVADTLSRRPDMRPRVKVFHDITIPSFNDTCFTLQVNNLNIGNILLQNIIAGYTKTNIFKTSSAKRGSPITAKKRRKKKNPLGN